MADRAVGRTRTGERPIRVTIVTTGLTRAGAETVLVRVATRLDRTRFAPTVVSLMEDGPYAPILRDAGIPVASIGFADRFPTPARIARLVRAVRRGRPDVIIGWMYHGNLAAMLGRAWGAPQASLGWNIRHSVYDLGYERFLTRQLIRLGARLSGRVGATVYVSDIGRRQHAGLGYAMDNALVIGNGLEERALPSAAERAALRAELGLSPDDIVVGHVARFHPMKDHATFLRAAAMVAAAEPTVRFVLVGREVTPSNPALAPYLDAPALAGRVTCLGERDDVARLLGAFDVYCMSSSFGEGFPNAVLEAAAAGIPCVVTDVGAAPEICRPASTVVPPRDPTAMADALLAWCRMTGEERRTRGAASRAHVIANYGLDRVVGEYAALFERLAGATRPTPPPSPER